MSKSNHQSSYLGTYFNQIKKNFKLKNFIMYFVFAAFILYCFIYKASGTVKRSNVMLLETIGYSIICALSLSLVVGFLGELSLGHAGFMSIGAFIGTFAQQTFFPSLAEKSPLFSLIIAMLIGGLVTAIFGFLIGLPALRLKGDYLAIVTLAFGEIVKVIFQNLAIFGSATGMKNEYRYDYKSLYIIIFIIALLVLILINNLLKSKHGRSIMAIRDNEIAARSMGVNVTGYKLFVFVISAFIAGIAGVLYGASKNLINSTNFDYNYSINNILVMVVLGGMGNINGTIVASVIVSILNVKLPTLFPGSAGATLKNIIFALVLVLVVIYNNANAFKSFREKYNFKKLMNYISSKLLKKHNPATVVDYGADWSKIPTKIDMDAIVSTDLTIDKVGPDHPNKGGKK